MPTNLPPEYYKIEEQFRAAESPAEKVMYLEEMLSIIPKHKGTDKLRADLRRKLSKLKSAAQSQKGTSRQVSPYQIDREGAGQIVLVGAPNAGKSALVDALTNAEPDVAEYPFTTQFPQPGMMPYENIQIQLIDTPPLSQEFEERQLYALIRRADVIGLVIDLQAFPIEQLEDSLALLREHRIVPDTVQETFEDEHRITRKPVLVLVNKVDEEQHVEDFSVLCELLGEPVCPLLPVSARTGRNLDRLKQRFYDKLDIVRVYSKPPGKDANLDSPFVMKRGGTLEEFAAKVHQDFVKNLKSARLWGQGVHDGQMVGRDHIMHDGDVVELRT
jgi:uncharacterized protein